MWVVKLGGSLCHSPTLAEWLQVLAEYGKGRVVIVPGGGPFADTVRQVQTHWRFSDLHAHHMALLAMEQYAWTMVGIEPRLEMAQTREEIFAALTADKIPVWLPYRMLAHRHDIPASWSVSADSLAAWLASEIVAEHLLIVKSVPPHCRQINVDKLVQCGIVDDYFLNFFGTNKFFAWWMGDNDAQEFAKVLPGIIEPPCKILVTSEDKSSKANPG